MRMVISLQISTLLWIGGKMTSFSWWMFMGLIILGRLKLSHLLLNLVLVRVRLLLKCWRGVNSQVFIKFWQNYSEQEVKYCSLRTHEFLIHFGIGNNFHSNGRCLLRRIHTGPPLLWWCTNLVMPLAFTHTRLCCCDIH